MSLTSRFEGLLHRVGLQGVVEEVRAMLGLAREAAAPRNEAAVRAPPPPVPQQTVVERTPRPAPVPAPQASSAAEAVVPAAKAAPASRAKAPRKVRASGKAAVEGAEAAAPKKRKRPSRARAKAKKGARAPGEPAAPQDASLIVGRLVEALRSHPRQEELISAGKQKDQLVRSLIPLYLARAVETEVEVTSGTTSRFWGEFGVTYAAPNAAKALRLHAGYAQDTKKGKAITPRGVQYVEETLERLRAPRAG